jgi:DNA mismatch endonuclease, patch repair protein
LDTLSQAERSERMARVKGKNTKPELIVRRITHRMGFRFRLHGRLPGRPDLVFPSRRKAIFVHGCFWHRHPDPICRLARIPKSRQDFWGPKLEGNRTRDLRVQHELRQLGWAFLTVWECELRDEASLQNKIETFLRA